MKNGRQITVGAVVAVLLLAAPWAQGDLAISFNRADTRVFMAPTDLAGAPGVRVDNWNNYSAGSTTLTGSNLVYNTGATVGGDFEVVTSGPAGSTADNLSINDRRMYTSGHLIMADLATLTVTFNNIPFDEYDLYFYVTGQTQAGKVRGGSIQLTDGPIYYFQGSGAASDDGTGYVEMTTTSIPASPVLGDIAFGNFISYKGLTSSSATVTTTAYLWSDYARAQVYGYQIVQVPEPGTIGLAVAGLLLALGVRRARR